MSDMVGTQHVTPVKEGWVVRASGQEGSSKIFSRRNEAIKYAREIAKKHNVCMVIHDEGGKFDEFECSAETRDKHVVERSSGWAVISEGGKEVSKIFRTKGAAMAHAYDLATKHNVCMLVHGKNGKFKSMTCPPDGQPGILEVFRMKLRI